MTDADQARQSEDYSFPLEEDEGKTRQRAEIALAAEPLFSALLRDVVTRLWPDDSVMTDFVNYVAMPLSDKLGHVGAKGGEFVEERRRAGLRVDERYVSDQSMRAHLIN